jgi:hypothetical protein
VRTTGVLLDRHGHGDDDVGTHLDRSPQPAAPSPQPAARSPYGSLRC